MSFQHHEFPTNYVPTVFDNSLKDIKIDGKEVTAELWDTAGQEQFDRIRLLSYRSTDVFLICFSLIERTSFDNIRNKWFPEIKTNTKNDGNKRTPIFFIVGTKSDIKDPSASPSKTEIENLKGLIQSEWPTTVSVVQYFETSAKTRVNVDEVFMAACRRYLQGVGPETQPSNCCTIL
eukprot:UN05920